MKIAVTKRKDKRKPKQRYTTYIILLRSLAGFVILVANKISNYKNKSNMLLSEFIERTGIAPEHEEWQAITTMYLLASVDKDEFCKLWCKMNAQRVKTAKEQKAKEKQEVAAIEYIERTYHKLLNKVHADFVGTFYDFISTSELEKINKSLTICGLSTLPKFGLSVHDLTFKLSDKIDNYWDAVAAMHCRINA